MPYKYGFYLHNLNTLIKAINNNYYYCYYTCPRVFCLENLRFATVLGVFHALSKGEKRAKTVQAPS
jgi:hypothetical protein